MPISWSIAFSIAAGIPYHGSGHKQFIKLQRL